MKAKKALGQNFLIDNNIISKILNLLNVTENDLIIEIGPGRGALTSQLINLPARLLCIELDTDMHLYLDKYESENCQIIYNDILQVNLLKILEDYEYNNLYIIGNLPYYITSPIIEHLILSKINIQEMYFMVQKEVAQRFTAKCGSKDFGYMSLFIQYYYDAYYEIDVGRNSFNPIPNVDSAVIRLARKETDYILNTIEYFAFLKKAFAHKRKTLKNNLKDYDWKIINKVLTKYQQPESVRAEAISQEIFIEIYQLIKDND